MTQEDLDRVGRKYLAAVLQAGEIYRYIDAKGQRANSSPRCRWTRPMRRRRRRTAADPGGHLADAGMPIQTIAPKFTGRFNKGVDYVGDLAHSSGNSATTWR